MTANKTLNTAISVVNAAVGKNRIINGNFDIWQRGTSLTSTNNVNEYSADRWRSEGFGASTVVSRQTFTGGQTDVPDNPTYYCRVALTSTNSAGYWAFQQRIESPQVMRAYGKYTLSFWVRASSGTVPAGNWNYGIINLVSGPALTTTWQKITQTIDLSSSAAESAGYVSVYLIYLAPNTPALSIDIAHVQVEAGAAPSTFETRPAGQELFLCQRYYVAAGSGGLNGIFYDTLGSAYNNLAATRYAYHIGIPLPVQMRTSPTVTFTLYCGSNQSSLFNITWNDGRMIRWRNDGGGFNPNSDMYVTYTASAEL